ncbi:MAG: Mov34/MPN/PAD-1 family protein [Candidatus Altiarchaeota archaeon]
MYRIRKEALEFILGVSRSLYPREFIGLLRAEEEVITEVIVAPAVYGSGFSYYKEHMLPVDHSIIGSVHSHPSSNVLPSKGDLHSFSKKGGVNLIVKYPYGSINDVVAYDRVGKIVELSVV